MIYVQNASRGIKSYLSKHASLSNLRISAFIISLLSCLVSGSILLFTLFVPTFHKCIGLSYLQINFIASISAGGMYLVLPALGYLSDCYGPSALSFLSVWFFVPSYSFISWLAAENSSQVIYYSIAFGMIGLATSSLYFSNLLTCAKIFPQHKGLAISLPITCYGLSALLGSQLLKLDYFHMGREIYKDSPAVDVLSISSSSDSLLNLVKVFKFFAILYLIVGILSFISSSIVIVEQDAIFANIEDMMETAYNNENSSLLSNELTIQRSIDPPNHKQRYIKFLKDVSAWILLVSLILNTGPLESYQNNLSSIISLMNPNNKSIATVSSDLPNKVSLLATSSTISRLVLGVSIDFLQSRKIGIVWLLVLIILMGALGQWFNNVALNGIAYGGLFTVYPTIIASVWGIDIMGSTWGSFMVAPAIGSIAYSLFYGRIADSDKNGMIFYFQITSFSLFISSILVLVACRVWYRRGQFV